jgi:hypothetical protein
MIDMTLVTRMMKAPSISTTLAGSRVMDMNKRLEAIRSRRAGIAKNKGFILFLIGIVTTSGASLSTGLSSIDLVSLTTGIFYYLLQL